MNKKTEEIELNIQTLGYYVDRVLCVMIKLLNKELKSHGLSLQHSDFTILKVLSETDGLTQSQLARVLGKEKSGIGRLVNSLEKDGYIVKNTVNGCTNHVSLSDKGNSLMPLLNEIANKVTDRAFIGFSEKKRNEMMNNLIKIYKNSI